MLREIPAGRERVMGFIAFIILGLIAGAIAKAILPGRQGGGWIATLILGVVGAILGGWLGSAIFGVGLNEFWSLSTWLLAIGGAIIVLLIWGLITGRKKTTR
jgi:uncharacterized membrane protein YeaQ/YmgE (transglycosylase-associated protein family)